MLITNIDLVMTSGIRGGNKTLMPNHRSSVNNGTVNNKPISVGPALQGRASTDFSIEAIMGRNNEREKSSPKVGLTAEATQPPQTSGKILENIPK